jgi:hypothetical protein
MKLAQKLLLALVSVAATTASASPDCRAFAGKRWDQRLAYAGCLRSARPSAVITDPEQVRGLVVGLAASVRPAIDIYRDALKRGPWETRLVAAYQLGLTYTDVTTRARTSIAPGLGNDLEPLLVTYELGAIEAFTLAQKISSEVPEGVQVDALVGNIVASTYAMLDAIGLE